MIGIDLGTTNSVVAVYDKHKKEVVVITDRDGYEGVPSIVAYNKDGRIVGRDA